MKQNEQGIVSLVTAIIVALFIMVITTSAVVLMVGELRQAIDSENSVRAYYAAESGAEDALLKIKTKINLINAGSATDHLFDLDQGCASAVIDAALSLSYSCQKISTTIATPQGKLQREEPLQYDLSSNSSGLGFNLKLDKIEVDWNQAACTDCDSAALPFTNPSLPADPGTWNAPALMEVALVRYPKSAAGALNQANIVVKAVVLTPHYNSGAFPATPPSGAWDAAQPTSVDCYQAAANDYNCRYLITGLYNAGPPDPKFNYVVRVRPRFGGTSYRLRFLDNAGAQINSVPDQYATVDVTGKAGDVYRRITERVKIRSGAFAGLDYVLYGDADICKTFTIVNGTFNNGSCASGF